MKMLRPAHRSSWSRFFRWAAVLTPAVALLASSMNAADAAKKRRRNNEKDRQRSREAAARAAKQRAALTRKAGEIAAQQAQAARQYAAAAKRAYDRAGAKIQAVDDRNIRLAQEYLDTITENVLQREGEDSELARLRKAMNEAQKNYQAAMQRVLSTPEYKQAQQRALEADDKATALRELRERRLAADGEARESAQRLDYSRAQYNNLRTKLLHADGQWQAASNSLREARAEYNRLLQQNASAQRDRAAVRRAGTAALEEAQRLQAIARRGKAASKISDAKDKKPGAKKNKKRK